MCCDYSVVHLKKDHNGSSMNLQHSEVFLESHQSKLNVMDLTNVSWQAAKGLEYLASKKCVHRDIAARNILVTEDYTIKIADFGFARAIQDEDYYKNKSGRGISITWTAPEALMHRRFTMKSNIWVFGIVLYEIFTHGGIPYPSYGNAEVAKKVMRGYLMSKPWNFPENIFRVMKNCWNFKPGERPTFTAIVEGLEALIPSTCAF